MVMERTYAGNLPLARDFILAGLWTVLLSRYANQKIMKRRNSHKFLITGNVGSAQLPLAQRAENVLAELKKRNGMRRQHIDPKIVEYLLEKGKVTLHRTIRSQNGSYTSVVPVGMIVTKKELVSAPEEEPETLSKKVMRKLSTREFFVEIIADFVHKDTWKGDVSIKEGLYQYECSWSDIPEYIKKNARCIWGVHDGKVYYAKSRATNPKKNEKVNLEEFTWVKLTAKKANV